MKSELGRAWRDFCAVRGRDQGREHEAARFLVGYVKQTDVRPGECDELVVHLARFDQKTDPTKVATAIQEWMAGRETNSRIRRSTSLPSSAGEPRGLRNQWPDDEKIPEREWLIEDWVPLHRVALFTGPGGIGKSTLGLQIAAAMACGNRNWLPNEEDKESVVPLTMGESAPVVFWTAEDELVEIARRIARFRGGKPFALDGNVEDRLHALDATGKVLWTPRARGSGHVATLGELTDHGQWLREKCVSVGARLVILDSLAAAYASDENHRGLVRAFTGSWDAWARDSRCTVLIIAHPPKSGSTYSGSTDWEAGVRSYLTFNVVATERRGSQERTSRNGTPSRAPCLELAKTNYGRPRSRLWIVRCSRGLWYSTTAEQAAKHYIQDLNRDEWAAVRVRSDKYADAVV